MADINLIKELRELTGLSVAEIKKALDAAGGVKDKALEALKEFSGKMAAKKADREIKDGIVEAYVHGNGKLGAMVVLACETDFVARNDEFRLLARDLAMHAAALRPESTDEMLEQEFVKDPSVKVGDLIAQAIGKLGENIRLTDVAVLSVG
ncbi:MAG TPA: elongation factor Ts [Candidatus Paceibacterota bacterium]|nr:elongation factor Ts [Candidatus Paceibacterota bacterium]